MPKFVTGLGPTNIPTDMFGGTTAKPPSKTPSGEMVPNPPTEMAPDTTLPVLTVESSPSKRVFHSTLFESFTLKATSTYNFYTKDEGRVPTADPSASLDQLPRYVSLSWKPAPHSPTLTGKGTRPFVVLPIPPRPATDFAVVKASAANGYVMPGVVNAILVPPPPPDPGPRLDEDMFLSDPDAAGEFASAYVGTKNKYTQPLITNSDHIKVNFIDPSIAGALDEGRINVATDSVHLNVAASVGKIAAGLEVISEFNQDMAPSNPIPTFPAPIGTPTLAYVGYIIERHDLRNDGTMVLGRSIEIPGIDTTAFIDREVLYGIEYAYKIRVVVQWVHSPTISFDGKSLLDRVPPADEVIGSRVATYYFGDWSDWARTTVIDTVPPGPPDELIVSPRSSHGHMRIVWKMPYDPQLDIDSVHLLRATVSRAGVSPWMLLGDFPAANGAFVDSNVRPHNESEIEYIYAMYSTSRHGEHSVLSEQVKARLSGRSSTTEHPLVRVAPIGADPFSHPNTGDDRETTQVLAQGRAIMYCREALSGLPLRDRDYLLDVRSLSTGERAQVALNVDSTEILSKDA